MSKIADCQLNVKSIGVCPFEQADKKTVSGVVVSYFTEEQGLNAHFTVMPMPTQKPYSRDDFLTAIATAERVKSVLHVDDENRPLDIYVCRFGEGKAIDVVARDTITNRYGDGFAEVLAANVKFQASNVELRKLKYNTLLDITVTPLILEKNLCGSFKYAVTNAFNAALLGRFFTREDLYLETKDGNRVKIEVRQSTKLLDTHTLFVEIGAVSDGFVENYVTEEFNYVDGNDVFSRSYKIEFKSRFGDYFMESVR